LNQAVKETSAIRTDLFVYIIGEEFHGRVILRMPLSMGLAPTIRGNQLVNMTVSPLSRDNSWQNLSRVTVAALILHRIKAHHGTKKRRLWTITRRRCDHVERFTIQLKRPWVAATIVGFEECIGSSRKYPSTGISA